MKNHNFLIGKVTFMLVLLAFSAATFAFAPASPATTTLGRFSQQRQIIYSSSNDDNNDNNNKKGGRLDENVRTKLLSESIAPWRTLRLFLYGALGSGALIGGLVNLSSAAAVFAGAKEGDVNAEVRWEYYYSSSSSSSRGNGNRKSE